MGEGTNNYLRDLFIFLPTPLSEQAHHHQSKECLKVRLSPAGGGGFAEMLNTNVQSDGSFY